MTRSRIDAPLPYQVEIEIPAGGLGTRHDARHAWYADHATDYPTRSAGEFPREAARFCFSGERTADAFAAVSQKDFI